MSDQKDIAKVIAIMSAAYPAWQVNEYTIEVYYQDLRDLPSDLLFAAAAKARTNSNRNMAFAPSTGEIRQAAAEILRSVRGVPSSYQAWQEVVHAMVDVGSYGVPTWSHPLIKQAVDALGWRNLCMSENAIADRARFVQAYDQLADRTETEMMEPPQVRGYIEKESGRELPAPFDTIKLLTKKLEK